MPGKRRVFCCTCCSVSLLAFYLGLDVLENSHLIDTTKQLFLAILPLRLPQPGVGIPEQKQSESCLCMHASRHAMMYVRAAMTP